ncbi:MAG: carbohydrate kinase [Cyanobacteriota bacterium]|nr:carbohydrate kinase [Cyanobacteriota bacterium]
MHTSAAPRVLCFGEALVDRLGPPGGDPHQADASHDRLGGAPANVACGLGRLGTASAFLGRVGEDCIGAAFAALFADRGVDTRALQWDLERPSRIVLVRRDGTGERSFGGFSGDRGQGFADQAVDAAALDQAVTPLLAEAAWLLCGTLPLASPRSAAALNQLLPRLADHGVALAVDVNWRPTFWGLPPNQGPPADVLDRLQPLLDQADLIKCTREEALWLFSSTDAVALQQALPHQPAVLVTDGPQPVTWAIASASGQLPAQPVAAVDTTGAGDAFTAGLLHQLVGRPQLLGDGADAGERQEALRFAAACGALVCRAAGAIDPQPTAAEVLELLRCGTAAVGP